MGKEQTAPSRPAEFSTFVEVEGLEDSLVYTSEGRSTNNESSPKAAATVISHRKILIARSPKGAFRSDLENDDVGMDVLSESAY